VHPISALQTEWSLWWREIEDEILPAARALGVGVVAYSPLGRGFLTGAVTSEEFAAEDFRARDPRFHGAHLRTNLALVSELRSMAAERDATVGQLALAWLLAQGEDVVAIPGTRQADRLAENAAAAAITLSATELERIDALAPRHAWSGDRYSFATDTARSAA
jgi:aryl-alcohol dehydrogenase-like predicted oxidoreductase